MVFEKLRQKAQSKPDNSYVVALDIGTEFVKALIAKMKDDTLEIVGVGRARQDISCLLYTSPSPRDGLLSRMPSSA